MQILAEAFARLAATRLSGALRLPCEVSLDLVDQMTYDEFMGPLASPSTLAVASMQPLKGQSILHIDAAGSDAVLERLFGAKPGLHPSPAGGGDLTEIEWSSLEKVIVGLLEELGKTWDFASGVEPRLMQMETEAKFCQIVPPKEMIVLTSFAFSVGPAAGRLDIVYPFLLLEPVIHLLSSKYWYASRRHDGSSPSSAVARRAAMPAEIVCDAGALTVSALRALKKGSAVPVPDFDDDRAWLRLGGARVAELTRVRRDGDRVSADFAGRAEADRLAAAEGADAMGKLAAELSAGLASVKDGVQEAMTAMAGRIDELKGGQEDLSDRVLYGQADSSPRRPERPFASLAGVQAESLALFLSGERAQVTALVLSFIDDALGARLLSLMPEAAQPEIARRVALMDRASPETMAEVERVLARKLATVDNADFDVGGVPKIVGMLNLVPRETEARVIMALDGSDPELAETIKRNMFVFEDIVILDDDSISAVLEEADERDILVAMKPAPEAVRERLFGRLPEERRERLKAEFASLGRIRLSECDAAGFRVVETIRRLEEEGRIGILRDGE